eukprot:g1477.t1
MEGAVEGKSTMDRWEERDVNVNHPEPGRSLLGGPANHPKGEDSLWPMRMKAAEERRQALVNKELLTPPFTNDSRPSSVSRTPRSRRSSQSPSTLINPIVNFHLGNRHSNMKGNSNMKFLLEDLKRRRPRKKRPSEIGLFIKIFQGSSLETRTVSLADTSRVHDLKLECAKLLRMDPRDLSRLSFYSTGSKTDRLQAGNFVMKSATNHTPGAEKSKLMLLPLQCGSQLGAHRILQGQTLCLRTDTADTNWGGTTDICFFTVLNAEEVSCHPGPFFEDCGCPLSGHDPLPRINLTGTHSARYYPEQRTWARVDCPPDASFRWRTSLLDPLGPDPATITKYNVRLFRELRNRRTLVQTRFLLHDGRVTASPTPRAQDRPGEQQEQTEGEEGEGEEGEEEEAPAPALTGANRFTLTTELIPVYPLEPGFYTLCINHPLTGTSPIYTLGPEGVREATAEATQGEGKGPAEGKKAFQPDQASRNQIDSKHKQQPRTKQGNGDVIEEVNRPSEADPLGLQGRRRYSGQKLEVLFRVDGEGVNPIDPRPLSRKTIWTVSTNNNTPASKNSQRRSSQGSSRTSHLT